MNFYFNYFTSIGREQSNYTLYTIHFFANCLFLKRLTVSFLRVVLIKRRHTSAALPDRE